MAAVGLSLLWTIAWWAIAWSHIPVFSEYAFLPLWLGYILVINGLSEVAFKDSLLREMLWSFIWLFVISIPQWWFFEYLNTIVQNWHYLYRPISELHYALQSSIDFSTVVPAVLSTAFLFKLWMGRERGATSSAVTKSTALLLIALGVLSFLLILRFPEQAFPLVWVAPLLVIDPINYLLSFPSLLQKMGQGRWLEILTLMGAALLTGFWWEFWNFFSYPKWFYTVPYVGFWKLFEMPLLGYGGYLAFGLVIWSYTMFVLFAFKLAPKQPIRL